MRWMAPNTGIQVPSGRFSSDLIKTEFVKLSGDGNAGTTGFVVDTYLVTGDSGLAFFKSEGLLRRYPQGEPGDSTRHF